MYNQSHTVSWRKQFFLVFTMRPGCFSYSVNTTSVTYNAKSCSQYKSVWYIKEREGRRRRPTRKWWRHCWWASRWRRRWWGPASPRTPPRCMWTARHRTGAPAQYPALFTPGSILCWQLDWPGYTILLSLAWLYAPRFYGNIIELMIPVYFHTV